MSHQPSSLASAGHLTPPRAGFAVSGSCGLQKVDDNGATRISRAASQHAAFRDSRREHHAIMRKASRASRCKVPRAAPARRVHTLRGPGGMLDQGHRPLRSDGRIVLSCRHGTGGDADDRQGNGGRHGSVPAPSVSADRADILYRLTNSLGRARFCRLSRRPLVQ